MIDPISQWRRYLAAGNLMRSTGEGAAETLVGANRVVSARTAIMSQAMATPWSANYGELARMLPEKIEALTRAGSAITSAWGDNQSLWMRHMEHLGTMTMRGRPPTFAEAMDLAERSALLTLRSVEATVKFGSAALAPFRDQVRDNVRRLETGSNPNRRGQRKDSH